jgi:spermidine/putrescine transport system permease protein
VRSRAGDLSLGAVFVGALVFLYLPIAVLVGLSFNESGLPTSWGGFSTKWYSELFGDEEIRDAAMATLTVAVSATALSVLVGTPLAFGLARLRSRLLDGLVFVPMIIPDIVLAIALLSAFNLVFTQKLGQQLGLWSIVLAHATFGIAFVAIVVSTRLGHFDQSTVEASLDLGAGELRTFLHVTLPQIAPGVIAGGLIVFTLSVDEFVIAYFTAGVEVTLPIKIYSMVRFGVTPVINALAAIVLGVSILLVLASMRLRGKEAAA